MHKRNSSSRSPPPTRRFASRMNEKTNFQNDWKKHKIRNHPELTEFTRKLMKFEKFRGKHNQLFCSGEYCKIRTYEKRHIRYEL